MRPLAYLAALLAAALVVGGATAGPKSGGGKAPSFGSDVVLPGGQGGEPSIAIDSSPTTGRGNIYVGAIGDSNGTSTLPRKDVPPAMSTGPSPTT